MKTDQVVTKLADVSERNQILTFLCAYEGQFDVAVIEALSQIIGEPNTIDNHNSFASLLVDINHESFIAQLINTISSGVPSESKWLADYMYALTNLLEKLEDYCEVTDDFTHVLGGWLWCDEGGEISWKASEILCEVKSNSSQPYLMRGALDGALLHLTRINCLRGVVNQYRDTAPELIAKLLNDKDEYVKEAATDAQAFIS